MSSDPLPWKSPPPASCPAPSLEEALTSSLQAVIEESRFSLRRKGVEGQVLGVRGGKLHVGAVLVLVVLEALVTPMKRADVRLPGELAVSGHQPLPHDAFGDDGVLFTTNINR